MLRLLFLWRLILLPYECIYKRVLIARYAFHIFDKGRRHQGPLWTALQTATRYGLLDHVQTAIETGEYMSKAVWKKIVKNKVIGKEQKNWQIHSKLFSSLRIARVGMPNIQMSSWWSNTQVNPIDMNKCRDILKLLLGCHKLNTCMYKRKHSNISSPLCNLCNMYEAESVEHMLFKCPRIEAVRRILWENVIQSTPTHAMRDHIETLQVKDKCVFLLSGLCNTYVIEWNEVYRSIATFVSGIYSYRLSLSLRTLK